MSSFLNLFGSKQKTSSNMTLSSTYDKFPDSVNDFDFHVYFMQSVPAQVKFARELYNKVKAEFPELGTPRFNEGPTDPHPVGSIDLRTTNPHQTGALFSYMTVNRGILSVLIHPHSGNVYKDHAELATWMGRPWPVDEQILKDHS